MSVRIPALAVLGMLLSVTAHAQCQFAGNEISNPDDPACAGRMLTYTESDTGADLIPLGYPVPQPVDSLTPVAGFRSYASLRTRHEDLAILNGHVASHIVGQTVSGRDIYAYVVGDPDTITPDGLDEPSVLVNGGIHAREWQSPEALTALLEWLAQNGSDDHIGRFLTDHLTMVLLPVLNIDGYLQTQRYPSLVTADPGQPREGRMRRKNLRDSASQGPVDEQVTTPGDNFQGVDLNRNSPEGFGLNDGSSASVTSLLYRGTSAASEPEIQALQAAAALGPESRLRFYTDVHSFSQQYFTPRTGNIRRDEITRLLARAMRAVTGFKYRYSPDAVADGGIGTTADYFAYAYDIPSWTLEIEPLNGAQDYGGTASHGHSGFILPDAEVTRMRDELTATLVLGFYRLAGPAHITAAQIRDTATGQVRYSARWQSSGDARSFSIAANQALVAGRDYTLWLGFSKPMRLLDESGAAVAFPGQSAGPASGSLVLELPRIDEADVVADLATARWLANPGGAGSGYQTYVHDAMEVGFSVPQDVLANGSTPAVLAIEIDDMSGQALDADPSTPVDWSQGHWTGLEDADGIDGDTGGVDCRFRPFFATNAAATAPNDTPNCSAMTLAEPEPPDDPPPPPPPAAGGSGGGGSGLWLLAGCLALFAARSVATSGRSSIQSRCSR